MKLFMILSLFSFSCLASDLSTSLQVEGVKQSKENRNASGNMRNYYSCDQFKGTYAGNSVVLKPIANGGSGDYSHQFVYLLGEGYQTSHGDRIQKEVTVKDGSTYSLHLPKLREEVSFVQQTVMVITKDKNTGDTVSNTILFNVTRPVVLKKSRNPEFVKNECTEIYPAYQSPIGILSNGSTNPSQLQIKQGIQKLWTSMSGSQWGYYFSPLAWTGLGNIFMFNKNYFQQYSKQVLETVEVSSGYQLSPGDYVQIYEQRTRYVSAFDAYVVGVCGESELLEEEYMLQWWGIAYHAVPINPFSEGSIPVETIGALPKNSCSDAFTPDFSGDNELQFVRTN